MKVSEKMMTVYRYFLMKAPEGNDNNNKSASYEVLYAFENLIKTGNFAEV